MSIFVDFYRLALLSCLLMIASTAISATDPPLRALGNTLGFVPPAPGTYKLEQIQQVPSGWVLEGNRIPRRLSTYTEGKVTLLSFIYTYCTDPLGCPLAHKTFAEVRTILEKAAPNIGNKVRLVSLSFDPLHDTPDVMRLFADQYKQSPASPSSASSVPWHFLTTPSVRALQPILDDLGQDVSIELDAADQPTRLMNHMLKVFLIDRRGVVREIYSVDYLAAQVVVNDILTLLRE